MPRDTNGNMSRVIAYAPGTKARANDVNQNELDIAQELSDSLSRTGKGKMLRPLELDEGGTGKTTAPDALVALGAIAKANDRMSGALSAGVAASKRLTGGVEEIPYLGTDTAKGNIREFVIAGAVTLKPTGLAAGDILQLNLTYESGSLAVDGVTYWELGDRQKSTAIADLNLVLKTATPYRLIFEVVAGMRTGIVA